MLTRTKPNKKFTQLRETLDTSAKLLKVMWQADKFLTIGNLLAVLVPAVVPFITAYIFKLIIDIVVASVAGEPFDFQQLTGLFAGFFVVSYVQRMAGSFQDYTNTILITKLPLTLYQMVLQKISSLDLEYYENSDFRDSMQKFKDSFEWRPLEMLNNLYYLIQSLVQVSIALVAIISLNPYLAVLLMVVALPDLYKRINFSNIAWGIWSQNTPLRKKYEYLSHLLMRAENIKELKIFQTSGRFLKDMNKVQTQFYEDNKSVLDRRLRTNYLFNFLDSVVIIGVAIYIVVEAIGRRITIGDIGFYQTVISNFHNGISGLFRNLAKIFDTGLYVKNVFELLEIETKIVPADPPVKVDFNKTPVVEFRNVTFSYPGQERKILDNFSLVIKPGEKIAFVGENGAGKTTLIKLLCRFYDVNEGEILVDGVNIKELDLDSWYKTIGVLFQDFVRYDYPVKDNIYFGRIWEKEDLAEIMEAAKLAGADPMIREFDQGYEQMLGLTFGKGIELSGGQWQKMALSRAFFRHAPILVLDEPTAAIDAKAEAEIFDRVEKLSKDKTVIIISHRFSTVRNADKIYVIENGKIAESGSHDQLMKLDGQYAALFKLQAKGYQ